MATIPAVDELFGRLAVMEFLMVQQLALAGSERPDIDAFFAALKGSLDSRIDRLPEESRQHARDSQETIFSSALQSAKDLAEFRKSQS